ncbi:MAG: sugar ABC transporter substrate-binding protein [Dehalococcoidia bacterium]
MDVKNLRTIAVLMVLALVAAACATGDTASTETTSAEAPDSDGIRVVRYLSQETAPNIVGVQRAMVAAFIEANPGVDLVLETADPSAITQKIATYLQAGAPLDVFMSDPGSAAQLASQGSLEPLDDVVEALGGEDALQPGKVMRVDGTVYAFNITGATPTLLYRTDLFEAAGLEPPETWEDLLEAARTLHSDEIAGIGLPGGGNRGTTIFAGQFLWQACGDFFNMEGEVTLDTPQAVEAVEFYAELLQYAPNEANSWGFSEGLESFAAGRSAMTINHRTLDVLYEIDPSLLDNAGIVALPAGKMRASQMGARMIALLSTSEQKDAAKAWIVHMLSPDWQVAMAAESPQAYIPTTNAAAAAMSGSDSPRLQAYGDLLTEVSYPAREFAYAEVINLGGIDQENCVLRETGIVNPYISLVHSSNVFSNAIQRVAYQGEDAGLVLADAQAELEALVADQ